MSGDTERVLADIDAILDEVDDTVRRITTVVGLVEDRLVTSPWRRRNGTGPTITVFDESWTFQPWHRAHLGPFSHLRSGCDPAPIITEYPEVTDR